MKEVIYSQKFPKAEAVGYWKLYRSLLADFEMNVFYHRLNIGHIPFHQQVLITDFIGQTNDCYEY